MATRRARTTLFLFLLLSAPSLQAAEPPALVNYQGVLRDAEGLPISGTEDMSFTFFSAAVSGEEILIDRHTAATGAPVTVDDGLFRVALGGGALADGSGPGVYTDLAAAFRDFGELWLAVEIAGETLSPRIQILSAGYALNADHLDGRNADFFLDTSGSPQEKTGQIIASGGIDFGGGPSDDLTAADVKMLTSGANADALHVHGPADATTLDGLDSPAFLRSNASDSYSSGTLTFGSSTTLRARGTLSADGELYLNQDGPDGSQYLYFFENGKSEGEYLRWNDGLGRFDVSDDLSIGGDVTVSSGGSISLDGELELGAATTDDRIVFDAAEWLQWDDSQTRFEFSDELAIAQALRVGSVSGESASYSWLGSAGSSLSGDMNSVGDLFVQYDIELGSNLYAGDSIIVGDPTPHAHQAYSSIGAVEPDQVISRISTSDDLHVVGDLQARGSVSTDGVLVAGTDMPDPDQGFSSIGDVSLSQVEIEINEDKDFYIQDDLQVGDTLYVDSRIGDAISTVAKYGQEFFIDSNSGIYQQNIDWYHNGLSAGSSEQIAQLRESGSFRIKGTLYENYAFDIAEVFLAAEAMEAGDLVRVDPLNPMAVLKSSGEDDGSVIGIVSTAPGVVLGGAPFNAEELREIWGEELYQRFVSQQSDISAKLISESPELGQMLARVEKLEDEAGSNPSSKRDPAVRLGDPRGNFEAELEGLALEQFFRRQTAPIALAGRVPVKVDAAYGAIATGDPLSPSPEPGVAMKCNGRGPVVATALEAFSEGRGTLLALVTRSGFTRGSDAAEAPAEEQQIAETREQRTPDPESGRQAPAGHLQVVLDSEANDRARFSVYRDGKEGLGDEVFRVDDEGNVFAMGAFSPASRDVAEYFPVGELVSAGDVIIASRDVAGTFERSRMPGDRAVVGVVAASPGVTLGRSLEGIASADAALAEELDLARRSGDREAEAALWTELEERFLSSHAPIALTGTVDVKVDAGYGGIRVGDLLTSSPTPGHAMRTDDPLPGTVIGKALSPLRTGTGVVRMLVMIR